MNNEDKSFMSTFLLVLGILVIFTVVVFMLANLLSTASTNATKNSDAYKEQQAKLIQERVAKIGNVETYDPAAKPKVRAGKEIFDTVCTTCHTTGVLNAPKLGTKADWAPRISGGFDALVTSGITGKGAMPPKGGDVSLTDMEMKKAVAYMLKESGLDAPDLSAGSGDNAAAEITTTPATAEPTPVAAEEAAAGDTVSATASAAIETVVDAGSNTADAIAATAGAVTTAVSNAVSAAKDTVTGTATQEASAPAVKTGTHFVEGKKVYKTACFACHDSGIAGAPKLGDKPAWEPRVALGSDALVSSVLNGKGGMPPKGGRLDLTPNDIKVAVDYMVSEVQ